jgi:hypothetical protein
MSFIPSGEQKRKDAQNKKVDGSQVVAKPITQDEDFCAELVDGVMDFSSINKEQFIVAVNTGDRNKQLLLASTIRGPFDFFEMVENVGKMWENEQHHAKVYILTKDYTKVPAFLDGGTIDYIEANYEDIIFSGIIEAELTEDQVIIPAGIIGSNPEDD